MGLCSQLSRLPGKGVIWLAGTQLLKNDNSYDMPLHFAKTLLRLNRGMVFVHVSGAVTLAPVKLEGCVFDDAKRRDWRLWVRLLAVAILKCRPARLSYGRSRSTPSEASTF